MFCEDAGHSPGAGPLPGFGKDQRIRLEFFFFLFSMEMECKLEPCVWFLVSRSVAGARSGIPEVGGLWLAELSP